MTVDDALRLSKLDSGDAELLLAFVVQKPRTWVLGHGDDTLSDAEERQWHAVVSRRSKHEPVAYITSQKEFYGRTFFVHRDVLIPRPATEVLIDQALHMLHGNHSKIVEADTDIVIWSERLHEQSPTVIVDGGTGSGCIAVTLACELPAMHIVANDLSEGALTIARTNAEAHHVDHRITFKKENMIDTVKHMEAPFLLVSNPPYIPSNERLMPDVTDFEPHQALFAGEKGIDIVRPLIQAARQNPHCVGFIVECRAEHVSS